jgi:hypothetical protein
MHMILLTYDILKMYDVRNCIWKYHKSMIYLKSLQIWKMYYTIKYAIIHYNIELVTSRSCTSMYHLDHKKFHKEKFDILMDGK